MADNSVDSELIMKFINDECSEEEKSYIKKIFCDQKKEKELESLLKKQWYELLKKDDEPGINLDEVLFKIHYEINTNSVKSARPLLTLAKWVAGVAAIIILPLAVFLSIKFYFTSSGKEMAWVEINAPAWSRVQFSLPDGTTGWLNSSSSLKYNGNFRSDRKVKLMGEAYFDVFKDSKKPFFVNTDEIVLSVVGTRFNIASYENEKNVEVVLEEGELIFNNKEMNKSYNMKPNDRVDYDKILDDFSVDVVESQKYTSWTEGKLVFRNDQMDVIARKLERWYNIIVVLDSNISKDLRLRATFVDESLDEVLYWLKLSLPIDYKIVEGELKDDGIIDKKKVIITQRK